METFEINSELSFTTVPEINLRGRNFIEQNISPVFALDKVTYSDNAGVALLISWVRYAKIINKKISFINIPKQLLALIKAGGLKDILPNCII